MTLNSHEIEIRVRYSETDSMGFLHHANHAAYFEMGRTELFRARGGDYRELEAGGLFLVVTKLECRYHKPASYDDVLTLETRLSRVTAAKIEHQYRLKRDGELLAEGKSILACVNREGVVQRVDSLGPPFQIDPD